MKQILMISFLINFITLPVFAQDDGQWTQYPVTDDLNLEYVTALTTDENGVLWAATDVGIYRFDGENWILYPYQDIGAQDHCYSMVCDDEGTLHLTAGVYITFRDDNWVVVPHDTPDVGAEIIDVGSNGDIWIGTFGGLLHYDGTSWVLHRIEDRLRLVSIQSIDVDTNGDVWFSTSKDELYRYDGINWIQYAEENGIAEIYDLIVRIGPDGTVWCGGKKVQPGGYMRGWIAQYDGDNMWEVIEDDASFIYIQEFEVDSTGNLWVSNVSDDFAVYDGNTWKKYSLPDYQAEIQSLTIDTNGIVWLGTLYNGIYRFDPNPTSVEEKTKYPIPVIITGNYPNPFNGSTLISFQAPERTYCELSIYSMNGQLIKTLVSDTISSGGHKVYWHGEDTKNQTVASGVYFARLQLGTNFDTHRMLYTK